MMPFVPQSVEQRLDYRFWRSDTYSYEVLPEMGGRSTLSPMQKPWEVRPVMG